MTRNDAELLRSAGHDPEAFREFYDRDAVWIRSSFLRHTGSEPAGLDLTAETFDQAWHAAGRFRDMAGPRSCGTRCAALTTQMTSAHAMSAR